MLVRRAEYSDQLTLLRLATECVNLMFHASRSDDDVERIHTRFIEDHATDLLNAEAPPIEAFAAAAVAPYGGAVQVTPDTRTAPPDPWSAIQRWGR